MSFRNGLLEVIVSHDSSIRYILLRNAKCRTSSKMNRLGGKINMHSWLTWIGDGRVNPALLISAMISAATPKLYKLNRYFRKYIFNRTKDTWVTTTLEDAHPPLFWNLLMCIHVHLVTDIHVKTDHKSAVHLEWSHHLSLGSFPQMCQRATFENQNWENRKNWAYHYPFQARSMKITKILSDEWSAYRESLFQRIPQCSSCR